MSELSYISAFLIGLLGSTHCLAMCGSLAGCFSLAIEPKNPQRVMVYSILINLGRISCYVMQGALVGCLGFMLTREYGLMASQLLRIFAAVMMILMGLYLTGWWRVLRYLEVIGARLWQRLTFMRRHLFPLNHPLKAYLLGICWGGLPCGLVYSTLSLALSEGHFEQGALLMICFGLGTLPSMIVVGFSVYNIQQWLEKYALRVWLGCIMTIMGGIMLNQSLHPVVTTCH